MKLLILLPRVPYPLEKGDKLRAFYQIKELSKKHEIYLCALNDTDLHASSLEILSPFCKEIHIFKLTKWSSFINVVRFFLIGKPLQCGYFYRSNIKRKIKKLIAQIQPEHIYCQLIRTAEYVKNEDIGKTIDYQDAFSKGVSRMIKKSPWWKRIILSLEYKRVLKYETDIFPYFDNKTIITQTDKKYIHHPQADEIVVVPNGVDMEFFYPMLSEKNYDLILTGNFSYLPNIDAAVYIVEKILPSLKEKYPNIHVVLCGANPTAKVLSLASEQVTVTGWVEDIRMYYAKSKILVAPMQIGTGMQNKLLEAMAMKLPCVVSPLAGKPLGESIEGNLIVCQSSSDYVSQIEKLLSQPSYYTQIAEGGYSFVKQNYNWEHTTAILEKLILQTTIKNKHDGKKK